MRVTHLLATTAMTAIAVGGATAAFAASGSATPSTAKPGARVVLSTNTNCSGTVRATSAAFSTTTLSSRSGRIYTGNTTVNSSAKPGVYEVAFFCRNSKAASTTLTIPGASTSASAMPSMGAKTGLGGSMTGGMSTGEIAGGAALLTAAVGGGLFVARRRTGNH